MLTLTTKENNKIYTKTSKLFTNSVYQLYKKNKYGMELCDDIKKVKKSFVYLMALSNYSTEDSFNCLNEEQIYNIYKQIKQIN